MYYWQFGILRVGDKSFGFIWDITAILGKFGRFLQPYNPLKVLENQNEISRKQMVTIMFSSKKTRAFLGVVF